MSDYRYRVILRKNDRVWFKLFDGPNPISTPITMREPAFLSLIDKLEATRFVMEEGMATEREILTEYERALLK